MEDDAIDAKKIQELRERIKLPEPKPIGEPKIVIITTPSPNEQVKSYWKNAVIKAKEEPPLDDKSRFRKLFQQVDMMLDRHAKRDLHYKEVLVEFIDDIEADRRERGEIPIPGQFQYEWVPKDEKPLDTPESVKSHLFGDWNLSAKPK